MKHLIASLLLTVVALPATAAIQTVTLSVPGMSCAACPITVKKALVKVSGVAKAEVSLDKREARVTFDDTRVNVEALTHATREAGYPSTPVGNAK